MSAHYFFPEQLTEQMAGLHRQRTTGIHRKKQMASHISAVLLINTHLLTGRRFFEAHVQRERDEVALASVRCL